MIKAIFIASEHNAMQQSLDKIDVIAGKGIVGDRNYDQHRWHGQNITLVESESIEHFNQHHHQSIALDATRRNLITQGVSLNNLVGQEFFIGPIKLIGTERCEPCLELSQQLATKSLSKQHVLAAFMSKAGIRASILSDGEITVGMTIQIQQQTSYD